MHNCDQFDIKMNYMIFPEGMNYIAWPIVYYTPIPELETEVRPDSLELSNEGERKQKNLSIKLNISKEDLCKVGYHHKRNSWTQEEDKKLLELVKTEASNWDEISKKLVSRNSKMCYSRYRRLSYDTKKRWSTDEEKIILQLIQKQGLNWKKISQALPNRTARQIQQHYEYCLKPNLNKSKWSMQEDLLLIELLQEHGTQWKIIQEKMGNRTENQIKNRYYGRLLKICEQKQKNRRNHLKMNKEQKYNS